MKSSMETMISSIVSILGGSVHSIWLYGSVVHDDFRFGWSDIDFNAYANAPLTDAQAEKLLTLRQSLGAQNPESPYFRCFEGVITTLGNDSRTVYWGTSGQRIVARYEPDTFDEYELWKYGVSVYGSDDKSIFRCPSWEEMIEAIRRHYNAIRTCAVQTDKRLYSCGWLLDIARCIYTLHNHDVIAKTKAGEWALSEHLFPHEEALRKTLTIRRDPLRYKDLLETQAWLENLGPIVQDCADVLEKELNAIRA